MIDGCGWELETVNMISRKAVTCAAYVYVALDELPVVGFGDDFVVECGGGARHL